MKRTLLIILFLMILSGIRSYGQLVGKWITTNATIFNNPSETVALDSVMITFKKNNHYTMDLYSIEAFPFHKQPWKNYFWGKWMLSTNTDSLICYNNIEEWIHKTERQDFVFIIKKINENELLLEGYGKEKTNNDGYIAFPKTPLLQVLLTKRK